MVLLNLYDYQIPQQILGLLIFLGIPLMIILEVYFEKIRKIYHVKTIFGVLSILLGSIIVIIAIWGNIGWKPEYIQPVLGPHYSDYRFTFYVSIIIAVGLIIYGMLLIHKAVLVKKRVKYF
ncbi:MAG: hypothetical protein ACFFA3_12195 [Promethearchaeota archaeon]